MDPRLQNSLTEGDFGGGLLLRQGLTEGDFWTLRGGCHLLYRGRERLSAIDYACVVAVREGPGEFEVLAPEVHRAGSTTFYAARRVSGTGKLQRDTTAVVRLALDKSGLVFPQRPNQVRGLRAEVAAGRRVRLRWWYWPLGQQAEPARFAVYGDAGTGEMNHRQSIGNVPYRGAGAYESLGAPGEDNQTYHFCVRAVTAEGVEDGNLQIVAATVRSMCLAGVDELLAQVVL